MKDHRVRLNDRELELVITALRARIAGVGADMGRECQRLAERLNEGAQGNPDWILGRTPAPKKD